jgi:large subunit ribosomal protein L6
VAVKGQKGELRYSCLPEVTVQVEPFDSAQGKAGRVIVKRTSDSDEAKARHGLTRQLTQNMVHGVTQGYQKSLEVIGVGYKAQVQGKKLSLSLGLSHPIEFAIPEGITVTQDEKNRNLLTIHGIDRQLVGQVAAMIRGFRPPEPYKGKGIRYSDEVVRRKPGKAAVSKGAPGTGPASA